MKVFFTWFLRILPCYLFVFGARFINCYKHCSSSTSTTFDQLICRIMNKLYEETMRHSQVLYLPEKNSTSSNSLVSGSESGTSAEVAPGVSVSSLGSPEIWSEESLFADVAGSEEHLDPNCGHTLLSQLIVGGHGADHFKWPWFARVGKRERWGMIRWRCGGSLISSNLVLTAAHCYNHV